MKKSKSTAFSMTMLSNSLKRYDTIKSQSKGATAIVTEKFNYNGAIKITVRPYTVPENKLLRFFKFLWLRIQLHYS